MHCQGRLGGKPDLAGNAGVPAAGRIVDPALGEVQLAVDHGVPGIGGVDEVDGDLGVLDPAGGAGVLALHPNGSGALLQIIRLVDGQHRLRVAEMLDEVGAHVVADRVLVPDGPGEQVLHPVRALVAGVLGDRPAVLAWQVRQESENERLSALAWLHPTKPARDPAQQLLQARLPAGRINVYAAAGGHRLIFGCPHNTA
jgi:hypothetical protein